MKYFLLSALYLCMVSLCKAQDINVCKSISLLKDLSSIKYKEGDSMIIILKNASPKKMFYSIETLIYVDSVWRTSATFTGYYNHQSSDSEMEQRFNPENKGKKFVVNVSLPGHDLNPNDTSVIRFIVGKGQFSDRLLRFRFTIYLSDMPSMPPCILVSSPFAECKIR